MAATAGIENLGDLAKDIGEVEFKHTLVAVDEDKLPLVFRGHSSNPSDARSTSTTPGSSSSTTRAAWCFARA